MEHTNLADLIWSIENGTNLHICIAFLDNYGNHKTKLAWEQTIHSKPYCEFMKNNKNGLDRCMNCRNAALKKAINKKLSFGGLCCNGIYEYCRPVIMDNDVIAVIFVGNILRGDFDIKDENILKFAETFESDFSQENCSRLCNIIENHIKLLIDEYSDYKPEIPVVITNIKNYLRDITYSSDISVSNLAQVFSYNEKYIGKLFKKHEGKTIKEYINHKRLEKAKNLLNDSDYNITEISNMVGFNNVTYFSKMFKKVYGFSPSGYKNKL